MNLINLYFPGRGSPPPILAWWEMWFEFPKKNSSWGTLKAGLTSYKLYMQLQFVLYGFKNEGFWLCLDILHERNKNLIFERLKKKTYYTRVVWFDFFVFISSRSYSSYDILWCFSISRERRCKMKETILKNMKYRWNMIQC